MFVLEGNISIGNYSFKAIHDVEIVKSVDELGDTCVIQLPTRFKVRQNNSSFFTEEAIKVGDAVRVTLAYKDDYEGEEFVGFVKKIRPTFPLEIHCEDNIWLLRRKNITKAWNDGTTLKEVLQEVVNGTIVTLADNIPDIQLDKYIIKNANGAQVLQAIKKNMSLSVFINDENKLYVGLQQLTNIGEEVIYDLNYNLVENNLEYKTSDERRIKIRYTYIGKDNEKKQIEVGDPDGELRTFHTSVISDESKLKELAESEISRLKYDGFDGDVTSFLIPYATRGMKAKFLDNIHQNREGSYFITKVVTSFGLNGARRKVNTGGKL
ncbi:MAG: late control protein [Psychroserpens sp.]|uniref:late control protein n=1 Tax=Psychroserpens sp. TaxID=2020870 RepID=UPI003C911CB9